VRRGPAGAALALLLVLAGCTAAPDADPTASASPRPVGTPTPVVLEVPRARVPGDCAQLLPPETLAQLGVGWVLARDGSVASRTALQTARRQAATADCEWAGPGGATLAFLVVPDARQDELSYSIRHLIDDGVVYDPVGQDSLFVCDATGCDFSVLVADEHWLAGRVVAGDPAALPEALAPVVADVKARVLAALVRPNPGWALPPAVHPGWGRSCGDKGLVEGIARLVVRPGLEEADIRFPDHDLVVVDRVDPAYCRLVDARDPGTELLFALVPGGAWAVPELLADPGAFERVEVEGLGTVMVAGNASQFTALTALQGSLVQVGMPAVDRAAFLDVLPDVVELVRLTPYTATVDD
jgi:hypothetical protein